MNKWLHKAVALRATHQLRILAAIASTPLRTTTKEIDDATEATFNNSKVVEARALLLYKGFIAE